MHPVQKHLFATNFKDLAGTRLEGTIALSDELINLGIMDFLGSLQSDATKPASAKPSAAPAAAHKHSSLMRDADEAQTDLGTAPDPKALLALLNIETLKFRTENGRAVLEVKASLK